MGFWNTFFSGQRCEHCNSYNTANIDFRDLSSEDHDMYWDTVGNVRPKDIYRCKDCGQLTIICQDGRKYWTHPAK